VTAFAGLPPAARARLMAMGPVWNDDIGRHRQAVMEIYGPLARAHRDGISLARDLAYGPHERHRLDVFRPAAQGSRPVVLFVHGGAFTRGRKSMDGEIYDNVLCWFARQGFVGVNVEYRLAPEIAYPAGGEDVADAVQWVAANIARFGGNPDEIILIGHSAGGTHVGTYLLDPALGSDPAPGVRGAVFISARLRADARPENPNAQNVIAYFGADESLFERRSPMGHAARCRWPVLIATAEYENRFLDVYGAEFFFRIAEARGQAPRFCQLSHHNHTSIVAHFTTGEERLGRALLDFFARDCGLPHVAHFAADRSRLKEEA
jgi:acetyl esterase/lipase